MNTEDNSLLTILITSHNRAEYVDKILEILYSYQKRNLVFSIVVSDDHSIDNTQEVCSRWEKHLKNYRYIILPSNVGMDGNFVSAYSSCTTEYCWLLGDHRYVVFEELERILSILKKKEYDALILNCHPRNTLPGQQYTEINKLLLDLGYNITNNASCIIPTSFFSEWAYKRYYGTTFLHMGIFVENLCHKDQFKVLFIHDIRVKDIILPIPFTQTGWVCHPFLNFGKLWYEFVMSLPNQIDIDNKFEVLLSHNRKTELFNIRDVVDNRKKYGDVYVKNYKENRKYVPYVSDTPVWRYDLKILVVPLSVFHFIEMVKKIIPFLKYRIRSILRYEK